MAGDQHLQVGPQGAFVAGIAGAASKGSDVRPDAPGAMAPRRPAGHVNTARPHASSSRADGGTSRVLWRALHPTGCLRLYPFPRVPASRHGRLTREGLAMRGQGAAGGVAESSRCSMAVRAATQSGPVTSCLRFAGGDNDSAARRLSASSPRRLEGRARGAGVVRAMACAGRPTSGDWGRRSRGGRSRRRVYGHDRGHDTGPRFSRWTERGRLVPAGCAGSPAPGR